MWRNSFWREEYNRIMNKSIEQSLHEIGDAAKRKLLQAFFKTRLDRFVAWCAEGLARILVP